MITWREQVSQRKGVALALSGGGFRATLFHLGTLRRLNELGVLTSLDAISSVSGGSIATACLAEAMIAQAPVSGKPMANFDTFANLVYGITSYNLRRLIELQKIL